MFNLHVADPSCNWTSSSYPTTAFLDDSNTSSSVWVCSYVMYSAREKEYLSAVAQKQRMVIDTEPCLCATCICWISLMMLSISHSTVDCNSTTFPPWGLHQVQELRIMGKDWSITVQDTINFQFSLCYIQVVTAVNFEFGATQRHSVRSVVTGFRPSRWRHHYVAVATADDYVLKMAAAWV